LRHARRTVPGTAQAAAVLMAVSGAIHLGLVSTHLEEPITSALFLMNGVAYVALSQAFTWRWWRLASSALLTSTILGYLLYIALGFDTPDQVALATKLIELVALGLVLVPVRGESRPPDRAWYWAALRAGRRGWSTRTPGAARCCSARCSRCRVSTNSVRTRAVR